MQSRLRFILKSEVHKLLVMKIFSKFFKVLKSWKENDTENKVVEQTLSVVDPQQILFNDLVELRIGQSLHPHSESPR
jgi:hypothetical protein